MCEITNDVLNERLTNLIERFDELKNTLSSYVDEIFSYKSSAELRLTKLESADQVRAALSVRNTAIIAGIVGATMAAATIITNIATLFL